MLNLAGNTSYLGFCYTTFNFYNNASRTNIYSAAGACGYPGGIVFYVGHGYTDDLALQWCITDNSGERIWDNEIFPHSICKNVFFTFLWSCHQGEVIGGSHLWGTPYGMPYAWRHSNAMSENGYTNPVGDGLFIGFSGISPCLTCSLDGVPQAGKHFAENFYTYGFQDDYTVRMALDSAACSTFVGSASSFADCILYTGYYDMGRMVVYGCSILKLHDYGIVAGDGGGVGDPIEY